MQKTFTLGSIEITVRDARTIRDGLKAELISQRAQSIEPDKSAFGIWDLFGELCIHTVSAKGIPFDPVTLYSGTANDAYNAYEAFMGLPKRLRKLWSTACNEVDEAEDDPVTGPSPLPEAADPNS